MEEIWKTIAEAPNYEVSNLGNIRNIKLNKPMKPFYNNSGYCQVVLRNDNKNLYRLVHRLVAITFLDNPNGYAEVNHKDFNKSNNTVDNLEWVSHKINMKHNRLKTPDLDRLKHLMFKEVKKIIEDNLNRYVINECQQLI